MAGLQCLAEVLLKHASDDKADDKRCARNLQNLEQESEKSEEQDALYVKYSAVGRITADAAHNHDAGKQDVLRDIQELYEYRQTQSLEYQHENGGNDEGQVDTVDVLSGLVENQGTRADGVYLQTAQEDGGYGVARDTHAEQRNHGTADGGVVGALGSDDAVDDAGTELLRILGTVLRRGISQKTGGGTADAGQNTDADTDDGGDDGVRNLLDELGHGDAVALQLIFLLLHLVGQMLSLETGDDDIGDSKHTNQENGDIKAAHQLVIAEGEADHRVDRRHADHGKGDTDQTRDKAVQHVLAGQRGDDGQGEDRNRKVIRRAEQKADLREQRGDKHQGEDTEDGTQERVEDTDAQGAARLTFFRHRTAVEYGGDGGWSSRNL